MPLVGSVEAHDAAVAFGALPQVLLFITFVETISVIAIQQMLEGSPREPGDYGFDPLKIAADPKKKADMQLKEITHARLAMLAFSGVVTQAVLTGKGFPYM
jgi:light-harvesting complex I chlorophyll a/b binding protein 1